eukprot:c14816_g1_i1.p2 GENE.c14816_g1_i1~~c14816_g1_i1.p2  ORF type:complete len:124 (-),score=15.18 c14816_g1_i1:89-460(-)
MFAPNKTDLAIRTDCLSLIDHLRSLRVHCSEKRLLVEIFALKEAISTGEISAITHISTELNPADGMTKSNPQLRVMVMRMMEGRNITSTQGKSTTGITQHTRATYRHIQETQHNINKQNPRQS